MYIISFLLVLFSVDIRRYTYQNILIDWQIAFHVKRENFPQAVGKYCKLFTSSTTHGWMLLMEAKKKVKRKTWDGLSTACEIDSGKSFISEGAKKFFTWLLYSTLFCELHQKLEPKNKEKKKCSDLPAPVVSGWEFQEARTHTGSRHVMILLLWLLIFFWDEGLSFE